MAFVNSCPKNKAEYLKASGKLQCGTDKQNNIQYLCLPNQEKTSLVEFCFDGMMGAREKGNCMEATLGKVIERSCRHFTRGCPNNTFMDFEFYKYPACQNINTKHHCYVMDPSCSSLKSNEETSSHDTAVYIGSSLGGFILIIAVVIAIFILKRRQEERRTQKIEKDNPTEGNQKDGEGNALVKLDIRKKEPEIRDMEIANLEDEGTHFEEEIREVEFKCCGNNPGESFCCHYGCISAKQHRSPKNKGKRMINTRNHQIIA